MTFALTQVMSNTAGALVMLPIAAATGVELGISSMPLIIAVTMGAHGAFLTPVATPVNLMVMGPGAISLEIIGSSGCPSSCGGLWWLLCLSPCIGNSPKETRSYSVWRCCFTFFETVEDGRVHSCFKKSLRLAKRNNYAFPERRVIKVTLAAVEYQNIVTTQTIAIRQ